MLRCKIDLCCCWDITFLSTAVPRFVVDSLSLSLPLSLCPFCLVSSSTAQGGDGSFKNRKPIGEVGCCESRMAERIHWWTERWLRSPLFLSLSLSLPDYPPTYLPIYLCIYLSIDLSIYPSYPILAHPILSIYLSLSSNYLSISLSPSLSLSIYLSTYLPTYLSIYLSLSLYLSIYLSIHLSIYLSLSLSVCLSIYLSASLKTKLFCETSSIFALDNIKNAAIQRDFLNCWTWQHQKRSNAARLTHFLSWQHQKRSNSARLPSKMESWVQSWRPRTNAFCDFSTPPVLTTAPATKKWYWVIRNAAPVTQNHLSKPEDLMLQNATPLRKSAPGPSNSSDEHVSCTAPATENASLQILFKCPTPAIVFGNATKPSRFANFRQGAQSRAPATRNDIWTSKSGAFHMFDFEMCFAPQRRTLLRHLNFQRQSEHGVLCTFWRVHFFDIATSKCAPNMVCFVHFWLRNVLRATTPCTFWTSQLQKVLRTWGAFSFFTCKCASHHNGVQFFISHLASWLRTRRFSEPTFRPSGDTNHWKNTVFRDFPTFSRTWIFFLLKLSLLWSSFFFSSLLWLFPSLLFMCPYCRKFDF